MDPSNCPSTSPYDGSARLVVLPSHPPPPYGSQQIGGMPHGGYQKKILPVNHGLNPYNFTPNDLNSSPTVSSMSPIVKTERTSSSASFSTSSSSPELMRCKRSKFYGTAGNPPVAARRNERERNRVKLVNLGFATLRQHVPNGAKNKKMSKVETLRSAVDYINQLQRLLNEGAENVRHNLTGDNTETSSSPTSTTSGGSTGSYLPHISSGNDMDSSPVSSSTSPSYETTDLSFNSSDHQERCYSTSDDDIISLASKWFSWGGLHEIQLVQPWLILSNWRENEWMKKDSDALNYSTTLRLKNEDCPSGKSSWCLLFSFCPSLLSIHLHPSLLLIRRKIRMKHLNYKTTIHTNTRYRSVLTSYLGLWSGHQCVSLFLERRKCSLIRRQLSTLWSLSQHRSQITDHLHHREARTQRKGGENSTWYAWKTETRHDMHERLEKERKNGERQTTRGVITLYNETIIIA